MNQLKRQRIKKKYRQLLAQSNWDISFGDKLESDIDLFVYVVHVESGLIKLLGLCDQKDGKPSGLSVGQLSSQAGSLIKLYASDNYEHMLSEKEILELLGVSVGEYAKATQSYQIAQNMAGSGATRMIVLMYDDPHDKNAFFVRPNQLPDHNFCAEDIQQIARLILNQDRHNHPERFKSADILEFRATKVEL